MTKPLISVIVPYKNSEKYIERCINSLKQQEGSFEFIFVNDRSEDRSLQKVIDSVDDRFVLVENVGNAGVSSARNAGLEIASGDYITFLDSDDEMLPDAYDAFLHMSEADFSQSNHIRYYAEKKRTIRKTFTAGLCRIDNLPEVWFPVWSKLYSKDLVKDIRFEEQMKFGEDLIFNIECLARTKCLYQTNGFTVRHIYENKQSLSHLKTDHDLIYELRYLLDCADRHRDPDLRKLIIGIIDLHVNTGWFWDIICKC